MTLTIMTREMNAISYACASVDLTRVFIPTEFPGILKVLISDGGKEISPELAWRLCALTQAKIDVDNRVERQELPLTESDLMPNDVVVILEPLVEDLP